MLADNSFNWRSPELYVITLENISVMIAFYGLLSFYYATEKHISWYKPWPKFLCIKGVVFLTFWQSIGMQTMSSFGMVNPSQAVQIQNFLVCIEMFIASIGHVYIFPTEEWQDDYVEKALQGGRGVRLQDTLALNDFATDMKRLVLRRNWASASEASNTPKAEDLLKAGMGSSGAFDGDSEISEDAAPAMDEFLVGGTVVGDEEGEGEEGAFNASPVTADSAKKFSSRSQQQYVGTASPGEALEFASV